MRFHRRLHRRAGRARHEKKVDLDQL